VFEYSAEDGSVRSLTSKQVAFQSALMPLTVLFTANECGRTKAFTREVPISVAVARLLVETLVAGPNEQEKAAGASAPFPPGSSVRGVVLRGGELTVDFNERLQNVGGSCAAEAIRESVTQTLTRLPAVKRVLITAGGSRELALQP
jgi:spore germination protein GerM